jgi:hypothetical protein
MSLLSRGSFLKKSAAIACAACASQVPLPNAIGAQSRRELAKEGIITHVRAATGDLADDQLAYLQAHDVPILVCTPCAKARQIKEEGLIEGSRMATAAEFINMSCDAAAISL